MNFSLTRKILLKKFLLENDYTKVFQIVDSVLFETLGFKLKKYQKKAILTMLKGDIVNLQTGSGKTVVFMVTALLLNVQGLNVHIATFNEYLAERDFRISVDFFTMFQIESYFLNDQFQNDVIQYVDKDSTPYIAYGTLIDFVSYYQKMLIEYYNCKIDIQTFFDVILVDEVDSIVVDQNLTPIVVSSDESNLDIKKKDLTKFFIFDIIAKYIIRRMPNFINKVEDDILITTGMIKIVLFLLNKWNKKIELYRMKLICELRLDMEYHPLELDGITWFDLIILKNSFIAHLCCINKTNYIVKEGNVLFLNKDTGRTVESIMFGNMLHASILVKEKCIKKLLEYKYNFNFFSTLPSTFILHYKFFSGASGTVNKVKNEIFSIFRKKVVNIEAYKTNIEVKTFKKNKYISSLIQLLFLVKKHFYTNPILIVAKDIVECNFINNFLNLNGFHPLVLHAEKNNIEELEKFFILSIGFPEQIIISTNFLSRGSDIKLGGDVKLLHKLFEKTNSKDQQNKYKDFESFIESIIAKYNIFKERYIVRKFNDIEIENFIQHIKDEISKKGGLVIVQMEPFENSRIDRQILGRCGRQNDMGTFYLIYGKKDQLYKKIVPYLSYFNPFFIYDYNYLKVQNFFELINGAKRTSLHLITLYREIVKNFFLYSNFIFQFLDSDKYNVNKTKLVIKNFFIKFETWFKKKISKTYYIGLKNDMINEINYTSLLILLNKKIKLIYKLMQKFRLNKK